MFKRILNLTKIVENHSFFLFGPRQTGKSTWLKASFPHALFIDLLHHKTFQQLSQDLDSLEARIEASASDVIVVDEIQKLPQLLDSVHRILFSSQNKKRFILTGSSARQIKRHNVNLLGGRALEKFFYPLLISELGKYSLDEAVQWGTLPSVVGVDDKRSVLEAYVSLYLDQEIRAEGLSRNLQSFARFLEVAALSNSQQINFAAIASDIGLSEKTIANWFLILQDTLIGHLLPCFQQTQKRKSMMWNKFFYFDCGVANAILERFSFAKSTPEYGIALENLVFTHLKAWCSYGESGYKLFYWRAQTKEEVDFIITHDRIPVFAIEVKSTESPKPEHLQGLRAFAEDFPEVKKILLCKVTTAMKTKDGIWMIPVDTFLNEWDGQNLKTISF